MLTNHKQLLMDAIRQLKQQKNAVILAHYYQEADIQDVADFVGDSLGLSIQAASTNADIILFAGVHFMAETAKILNPSKLVLLPDLNAGCSLAESCSAEHFRAFREAHPHHIALTYINCSAEVKALSDIICTSSNALKILQSIPPDQPVLFSPDKNLGHYLMRQTGRDLLLWDGACSVHEAFSAEKIQVLKHAHPEAHLLVHPESQGHIIQMADFVGSTAAMLNYAVSSTADTFIVATEAGILHKMSTQAPRKHLIPAPVFEHNACACSECPYMKVNTLEKVYECLLSETPGIELPETLRLRALKPIERMLKYTP